MEFSEALLELLSFMRDARADSVRGVPTGDSAGEAVIDFEVISFSIAATSLFCRAPLLFLFASA